MEFLRTQVYNRNDLAGGEISRAPLHGPAGNQENSIVRRRRGAPKAGAACTDSSPASICPRSDRINRATRQADPLRLHVGENRFLLARYPSRNQHQSCARAHVDGFRRLEKGFFADQTIHQHGRRNEQSLRAALIVPRPGDVLPSRPERLPRRTKIRRKYLPTPRAPPSRDALLRARSQAFSPRAWRVRAQMIDSRRLRLAGCKPQRWTRAAHARRPCPIAPRPANPKQRPRHTQHLPLSPRDLAALTRPWW